MKLKEQLVQCGLTEEKAQEFIDKNIDGVFIPKARFDEVNEENKGLKSQIADRDTQLEQLKKSSGDNADLKAQIEKLQGENETQKEDYEAQIAQMGTVPNDNAGRLSLWADIVKHHQQLNDIRALENFSDTDVTVAQGDSKKSVVVTDAVTVVNAMDKLYMTVTVA